MTAQCYPDPLPTYVRDNPLRRAEIKVYEKLRSQLPSRYHVFYSRPWVGTNPDGTEKEGEADFIIASADTGFLVVEVKGGRVGRDEAGSWFSIDREDRRHSIKNPVSQALRSKNELLKRLRSYPSISEKWIGCGTAVILPDSTGSNSLEAIDTPADHFALSEDMPTLGKWITARLELTVTARGGELGTDGLEVMIRLVAGSFQLRTPLAPTLDADQQSILTVTEQQFALLEFLENHHRVAIAGAAGTGKTVLALHKASELARALPNGRVLLTCYNGPLAGALRAAASGSPNLTVSSFHSVCSELAQRAGVRVDARGDHKYFDTQLPRTLLEAYDRRPDLGFDGIVVDEGQDFSEQWIETLELILRNDASPFWVFYDDNQRLYKRSNPILAAMTQAPFVLRKNVRNPRTVFDRLSPFLDGTPVVPLGPKGRPVEEIALTDQAALPRKLSALVSRLVEDEQVAPRDIAVLVSRAEQIPSLCVKGRISGIGICNAEQGVAGRILVDTVRRFKGLERPVVVLVDPAVMSKEDDLLYVGISRATGHLILLGAVCVSSASLAERINE